MRPKYQTVADTLRREIQSGQYDETMLLPTEQALCGQFQVSRQTVRQALSLLASEGLIERRQGSGSHLAKRDKGGRRTVAVITTYISNYIFPSILREIETVLAANNCALTLYATQNLVANERKILTSLLDEHVPDGILVEGIKTGLPNPNLDLYQEITARGIPMVFLHGYYREMPDCLSVLDDNYRGGRMLVEYLYNKGHRAIMGLFKNDDIQGLQRYSGYLEGLRDLGLPLDQQHVFWYNTETKTDLLQEDEPWEQVLKTLATHPCIIAVFVGLVLMVAPVSLPEFLDEAIAATSSCTVPISMLVIGSILADAPIRSMFSGPVLWYTCLRLVLFPLLVWLVLKPFHLDPTLVNVCILMTGMPAGSTASILADKYDGDAVFASQITFASTLCSILTIPLLTLLMGV